jgi:Phage-related lysozyme (muraminidase)
MYIDPTGHLTLPATVDINGLNFGGMYIDGTTYVWVRDIAGAIGANVGYDSNTGIASVDAGNVYLTYNTRTGNGDTDMYFDKSASKTMVAVRSFINAVGGYTIDWKNVNGTIKINITKDSNQIDTGDISPIIDYPMPGGSSGDISNVIGGGGGSNNIISVLTPVAVIAPPAGLGDIGKAISDWWNSIFGHKKPTPTPTPTPNQTPTPSPAPTPEGTAGEMKVSDSLIDFLCDYEKFMPKPYYATEYEKKKGIKTIGFGHVIQLGENFDNGITLEQAKELLKKDLGSREETVRNLTKGVTINQQQFDALADFQFNTGNLASSDLLKHVCSGKATNEQLLKDFLSWTRQGSNHLINLYQRRYDEWEIFTSGEYKRNEKRKAPAGYI